jgi:hypothetical protein
MYPPSAAFEVAEWYIRIQIDFAHFRAQLTAALALTGILEFNIGTVLIQNSKLLLPSVGGTISSEAEAVD